MISVGVFELRLNKLEIEPYAMRTYVGVAKIGHASVFTRPQRNCLSIEKITAINAIVLCVNCTFIYMCAADECPLAADGQSKFKVNRFYPLSIQSSEIADSNLN